MGARYSPERQFISCWRCGGTVRLTPDDKAVGRRKVFCTEQCEEWQREEDEQHRSLHEAVRRWNRIQRRDRLLRENSLHVIYPQMMAVLTWAQGQRPSYVRWLRSRSS